MSTLYWIQVIGNLNMFFVVVALFFGIAAIMVIMAYLMDCCQLKYMKHLKKYIVCAIAFALASVFTPSTRQLYVIYGVGGVIEYAKENDTAKQLPDKAVIALDKWLDSISKEETKQ